MAPPLNLAELKTLAAARRRPLPAPAVRRAIRVAAGVTQGELAAVLGVTRPTITRFETGSREPRGALRDSYRQALEELSRR